MRKALLPLGLMVSLVAISACGPAPQPVAPKPDKQAKVAGDEASGAGSTTRGVAMGALDLAPVEEPMIIGMARWKNPSSTMTNLSGCSAVPPELIEGNSKKLADLILHDVIGAAIDTEELASIIALDAPIDAVVSLDTTGKRREPFAAISVGLTSLERARGVIEGREKGAPPVELAPGMWRIGERDNTNMSCVVAAAAGGAPARLICGDRDKDVIALGPYLARNAPIATFAGSDLHGELRFGPLLDKFGGELRQQLKGLPILAESQLSIGEPKFDKAISEAAIGLQGELTALLGDLDKVHVDIGVDPKSCLSASGALELRGKASWLAGTIADRPERAGAPPALFWQLPKDSDAAFYNRGSDPARYSAILQTLRTLIEGALSKANMGGSAADRKAVAALLAMQLGKDANVVEAVGHVDVPPADAKKEQGQQQIMNGLMRGWLGWTLVGVDEGPDAISKSLKDLVAVYNRQATLAAAYDKAERKEREAQRDLLKRGKQLTIEEIEAREKKLPARSLLSPLLDEANFDAAKLPTMKVLGAPASLGKGAMDIEIKVAGLPSMADDMPIADGKKPAKKETIELVLHILLMADEKTTWIALGHDKDELVKRLLSVKSGAAATEKLSSRAALEPLKNGKFMSGGFMTLVPFTKAATAGINFFAPTLSGGSVPPEVQEVLRILNSLPHRGEAPIFFTTEATGGNAPRASISFNVSQGVLEDVGALVMGGLRIASHMRP